MKRIFMYILYAIIVMAAVIFMFLEFDRQEELREKQYKAHYELINEQINE